MLVYQLLRAERARERGEGGRGLIYSQLQELVIEYLWLFGYFHYASTIFDYLVISTMLRTSLSMPEKGNIFISKQKHSFSQGVFVCKHENLSEHFEVVCTQKDGLRWVIFSTGNVGQLIPYYHISAELEHIYPEKQQNNSK